MKFEIDVPDQVLFASLEKDPKEAWDRFARNVSDNFGSEFSENFIRASKAVAEWQFDLDPRKCERIDEASFNLIRSALSAGKGVIEIAAFVGVSPSTVSRVARVGINLEFSQIKEMRRRGDQE